MKNQAEMIRLLAEKLPNLSEQAKSLQLGCADEIEIESKGFGEKAKKLLDLFQ